jgi:uncharacterized protein with PIN domain
MSNNSDNIRFIVDVMLGKLAKWLRILGFDAYYKIDLDDENIIKIAQIEKRIILTKDKRLSKTLEKLSLQYIFIENNDYISQLKQIIICLKIKKSDILILRRCAICNSLIKRVEKELIEGFVPDYVFNTQLDFNICEGCGKIYWSGSHINKIQDVLDRLFEK